MSVSTTRWCGAMPDVDAGADAVAGAGGAAEPAGPMQDVRIVELAHDAVAWAGRLCADLGAEVIVVGAPGGRLCPALGAEVIGLAPPGAPPSGGYEPFLDDEPGPERSLWWWHYNAAKRGVVADLTSDAASVRALVARADVLLVGEPAGVLEAAGLDWATLSAADARLVMVAI